MHRFTAIIAGLILTTTTSPATSNNTNFTEHDRVVTIEAAKVSKFELNLTKTYHGAHLDESGLEYDVFRKALIGYYNMQRSNQPKTINKSVISIIDFNKASSENRLWIIDLKSKKLLYNTLVAHGKNSGENFARKFSNVPNSEMSSLGFYVTRETYTGKHGLSLKLDGVDEGYNTNAYRRAIVVHGANYVSQNFVKMHGRLGRSQGCPALPERLSAKIINVIKNNSCLFINGPEQVYKSPLLEIEPAVAKFALELENAQSQI